MIDVPSACAADAERVAALLDTGLLDTKPEASFDGITYLAKLLMGAPMSAISLVDHTRQWFKSRHGFEQTETPRSVSFCTHAVVSEHPFVVLDAQKDPRFSRLPMVVGPPNIRFYLGMPLVTKTRAVLGALCVYDTAPRAAVHPDHLNAMTVLARLVVDEIELRRLAETDGLTNVLTNTSFRRVADLETRRAQRYDRPLSCIVIDVSR